MTCWCQKVIFRRRRVADEKSNSEIMIKAISRGYSFKITDKRAGNITCRYTIAGEPKASPVISMYADRYLSHRGSHDRYLSNRGSENKHTL